MSFGQGPVFSELLIEDKFYHSWSLKNTDISDKKKKELKQMECEPLQFKLIWLFLSSSLFFFFLPYDHTYKKMEVIQV